MILLTVHEKNFTNLDICVKPLLGLEINVKMFNSGIT